MEVVEEMKVKTKQVEWKTIERENVKQEENRSQRTLCKR